MGQGCWVDLLDRSLHLDFAHTVTSSLQLRRLVRQAMEDRWNEHKMRRRAEAVLGISLDEQETVEKGVGLHVLAKGRLGTWPSAHHSLPEACASVDDCSAKELPAHAKLNKSDCDCYSSSCFHCDLQDDKIYSQKEVDAMFKDWEEKSPGTQITTPIDDVSRCCAFLCLCLCVGVPPCSQGFSERSAEV